VKPMLAKTFDGRDVSGWWISEKLDGVRAIWTGTELRSRAGVLFNPPDWFTDQLPAGVALDGELWAGRGTLGLTVGAINSKHNAAAKWRAVRFMVYDAPLSAGGFEDRLAAAEAAVGGSTIAEVLGQRRCAGRSDCAAFLSDVLAQGGEGAMLRRPGSAYEFKRSAAMLKLKPGEGADALLAAMS
jgi:DNA ligase-1